MLNGDNKQDVNEALILLFPLMKQTYTEHVDAENVSCSMTVEGYGGKTGSCDYASKPRATCEKAVS